MFGVGGFGAIAGHVEVYWGLSFANTVASAVEVPAGN
jgi:hypothetical protein